MAVDVKTPYNTSLNGVEQLGSQSLGNSATLVGLRQAKAISEAQTRASEAANKYSTVLNQSANMTPIQTQAGGINYSSFGSPGSGANFDSGLSSMAGQKLNTEARQRAINAAYSQLGVDYSWGGGSLKGPSKGIGRGANTVGFDCSGLVRYAYAQAGKSMPRHSSAQFAMGVRTSVNNLRPGDLVGRPGHIAIYAGNGNIIESPRTGKDVRVMSMKSRGISDRGGWFGIRVKFAGE